MTLRNMFYAAILLIFMAAVYRCGSDPRRTRLPFGTTDLSSVQEPLSTLPPEERTLVEDYVKRSNGDVLPAALGDPDNPLTARTFGQAIDLQRDWQVKMQAQEAVASARRAERDARLAPLRALVRAEAAKAELITRGEWLKRVYPETQQPPDPAELFVLTVQIQNLGGQSVTAVRGSLQARDRNAYLPMDLCWIDIGQERAIPPESTLELPCTGRAGAVTEQERALAAGGQGRFSVEWNPRHIRLADGTEYNVPL